MMNQYKWNITSTGNKQYIRQHELSKKGREPCAGFGNLNMLHLLFIILIIVIGGVSHFFATCHCSIVESQSFSCSMPLFYSWQSVQFFAVSLCFYGVKQSISCSIPLYYCWKSVQFLQHAIVLWCQSALFLAACHCFYGVKQSFSVTTVELSFNTIVGAVRWSLNS